jgi:hypothetical protein
MTQKSILYLLLLLTPICAKAQVGLSYANQQPLASVEGAWAIAIKSDETNALSRTLYLISQITNDKGSIIYAAQSRHFDITQGSLTTYTANTLAPIVETTNTVKTTAQGLLSEGQYRFSSQLFDATTGMLIAQVMYNVESRVTSKTEIKSSKKLKLTGGGTIFGDYTDKIDAYSDFPNASVQANLQPTLSIGVVPIGLDWQYCAAPNGSGNTLNRLSLRFDAKQFKQNLQAMLLERAALLTKKGEVADLAKLAHYKELLLKQEMPNLDKLRDTFSNPIVLNELQELAQKEVLANILKNPALKNKLDSLKILEQQYKVLKSTDLDSLKNSNIKAYTQIKELQTLQEYYNTVETQKNRLDSLERKWKPLLKQKEKLDALQNLSLEDLLQEPNQLETGLGLLGIKTNHLKWLNGIRDIGIGTINTFLSPLTLDRVPIDGANFAYETNGLYVAAVGGQAHTNDFRTVQQAGTALPIQQFLNGDLQAFSNFSNLQLPPATMWAASAGWGGKQQSHLHFAYFTANQTANTSNNERQMAVLPNKNRVVSAEGQWSNIRKTFLLESEIAASNTFQDSDDKNILSWSNASNAHLDYSFRGKAALRLWKNKTQISASMQRIGADFRSFGVPYLYNNRLFGEARIEQRLDKKQYFKMSLSGRSYFDNIAPTTATQRKTTSVSVALQVNLPKGFYGKIEYTPFFETTTFLNTETPYTLATTRHLYNLMSGFNYKWKKNSLLSQINILHFSNQIAQANTETPPQHYTNNTTNDAANTMLAYTQNIAFEKPIVLTINATYTYPHSTLILPTLTFNSGLNATFALTKKLRWTNGINFLYYQQNAATRYGLGWQSSIPLAKWARFELSVQHNTLPNNTSISTQNTTNQWRGRAGVSFNF